MITIRMSAEDLAHTRFAFSALWETVASLRIHHKPQSYAFHLPWLRETRPLVDHLDIEPIRELIYKGGYPDFLTLPPTTPLPRFEDELEQLRQTPIDLIHKTIHHDLGDDPPPAFQRYFDDPRGALDRLTDALYAYWDAVVRPYWPRLRAVLEADVHFRGQLLALKGPDELFSKLSAGADYQGRTLRLDTCKHDVDVQLQGNGLLLIPSVFMLARHYTVSTSSLWQETYQYAARGVAGLWNEEPVAADEAFEQLLSGSRARLLRLLVTPATTSQLAERFGVTPSAISQHLGWLKGAGLVAPQRRGRSVFYELSPIGSALLEAYGEIERPEPDPRERHLAA